MRMGRKKKAETVRDRLWIWGHPAGAYNDNFIKDLPRKSTVEPVAAADYMGIRNMIFVLWERRPVPPFDEYYQPFKKLDRVIWSLTGASGLTSAEEREHAYKLAAENPNVAGFILDDFFHGHVTDTAADVAPTETTPFEAALAPDELKAIREQLVIGGKRLPLVVVVYTGQISPRALQHLEQTDQITMWTWDPAHLKDLESNFERLEELAPGKPIYLGCYMYDFLHSRPLSMDLMKRQCQVGLGWLAEGRIEGMIFLATPLCDVGLEAVEWARGWIAEVGDEAARED